MSPESSNDDAVLATVEQRVRDTTNARLGAVGYSIGGILAAALAAAGTVSVIELLSRPDIHRAITAALDAAASYVAATVRAGYRAGVRAAKRGEPDETWINAVLDDVQAAFAAVRLDLDDSLRAAHTRTADADRDTQIAAVRDAVDRTMRRLGVRVNAAGAAAVHRGYSDGQLAEHADAEDYIALVKRWEVRSANPCPACRALHGTVLPLDAEFDPLASDDPGFIPPRTYRDLTVPPRHPNCRCRIVIELSPASGDLRQTLDDTRLTSATYLDADAIRRMPAAQYEALIAFLGAALQRIRDLLDDIRHGD